MKKVGLTFIIAVIFTQAFTQNSIEHIQSDSAVLSFFKEKLTGGKSTSNYNDFKLSDGKEWINYSNLNKEQIAQVLSKYKYDKWSKVDLNGDGSLDLILSGYLSKEVGYSNHFRIFIFLSKENDNYEIFKFNYKVPTYYKILQIDGKPAIKLHRWQDDLYKTVGELPLRIDTVYFDSNTESLLDYPLLINPNTIAHVLYTVHYLPKGQLEIKIVNNGVDKSGDYYVQYDAQNGTSPKKEYAKVTKEMMKDFMQMLARLPKYERRKDVSLMMSEEPQTTKLTVVYTDGTSSTLEDSSGESSVTLSAIYNWIKYSLDTVYEQSSQEYNNPFAFFNDPFAW